MQMWLFVVCSDQYLIFPFKIWPIEGLHHHPPNLLPLEYPNTRGRLRSCDVTVWTRTFHQIYSISLTWNYAIRHSYPTLLTNVCFSDFCVSCHRIQYICFISFSFEYLHCCASTLLPDFKAHLYSLIASLLDLSTCIFTEAHAWLNVR